MIPVLDQDLAREITMKLNLKTRITMPLPVQDGQDPGPGPGPVHDHEDPTRDRIQGRGRDRVLLLDPGLAPRWKMEREDGRGKLVLVIE